NRGPEDAELHVLPTLWFRNTWASWVARPDEKPMLTRSEGPPGTGAIVATHPTLGVYHLYCDGEVPLLFTDNETNNARLFPEFPTASRGVEDGSYNYLMHHQQSAVNPAQTGPKVSTHYRRTGGPGRPRTVLLRVTDPAATPQGTSPHGDAFPFGAAFDAIL